MSWTQEQLARAIGSSQSRIAKFKSGDPGIYLDLKIKALLQLGTSKKQIGKFLGEALVLGRFVVGLEINFNGHAAMASWVVGTHWLLRAGPWPKLLKARQSQ